MPSEGALGDELARTLVATESFFAGVDHLVLLQGVGGAELELKLANFMVYEYSYFASARY